MSTFHPGDEPVPGYRLLQQLGHGGFGVVWRASGPSGEVALKFVSLENSVVAHIEERSLDLMRGITHPNLISIHDSWMRQGYLVIAMELADQTLHDLWEQARRNRLPGIPLNHLLDLMEQAACGVDYLNAQQHPHPAGGEHLVSFQHRDIKPRNLLVASGRVKVADWGLVRMLENSVTGHTGSLTVAFAAPEFFHGRTTRFSDQYSLAVSYAFLRTGELPFRGDMREAHLHHTPNLGPISDDHEKRVLLRAMEKNSQNRWTDCQEFVRGLRHSLQLGNNRFNTGESEQPTVALPARATVNVPAFHAGGVVPPRYFIDRESEQAEAQAMIHAGQSFLVVGPHRAGKTSFCRQLIHRVVNAPGNQMLPAYLNLQNCPNLNVETFREHTLVNLLGEIARQVFRCKYTDLLRDDPTSAHPVLRGDSVFESFVHIFRLVTRRTHMRGDVAPPPLVRDEFTQFIRDLLEVVRLRGWTGFALFYDEANRLPQELSVQLLVSNEEYLNADGVVSVYVASHEMADAFHPLLEVCGRELVLGPFSSILDLKRLLSVYCFENPDRIDELPVTEEAIERLWEQTTGQPYQIQLIAQRSFGLARAEQASHVRADHVDQAFDFVRRDRPHLFGES